MPMKRRLVPWTLVPVKSKVTVQKICDGLLNDMLGNEIPTENNPAINTTLNTMYLLCIVPSMHAVFTFYTFVSKYNVLGNRYMVVNL